MPRTIKAEFLEDGSRKKYCVFAGTSDEEKPVSDKICTGSLFHEVDTTTVYAYNENAASGSEWVEQIQLGGDGA